MRNKPLKTMSSDEYMAVLEKHQRNGFNSIPDPLKEQLGPLLFLTPVIGVDASTVYLCLGTRDLSGSRISTHSLSAQCGLAAGTVSNALQDLEQSGLIEVQWINDVRRRFTLRDLSDPVLLREIAGQAKAWQQQLKQGGDRLRKRLRQERQFARFRYPET